MKNDTGALLSDNTIEVAFFNARSIANKIKFLDNYLTAADHIFDLIFITETWLSPAICDSMICPNHYLIMRNDRQNSRGGSVLVLYKSYLHVSLVSLSSQQSLHGFESITVDVHDLNGKRTRFSCYHVPPSFTSCADNINDLCDYIHTSNLKSIPTFIFGDFNLPNIDWTVPIFHGGVCHEEFLNFCTKNSLLQTILQPTHISGHTLDILLGNPVGIKLLNSWNVLPPLTSTCDHCIISFNISTSSMVNAKDDAMLIPNFKKAYFDKILAQLQSVDWLQLIESCKDDVQVLYDSILNVLLSTINCFVPLSKKKTKSKQLRHLKRLLKQKIQLYKQSKHDSSFKRQYKQLSKQYDIAVSQWHDHIESKVCNNQDPKSFSAYTNSKLKDHSFIPPLKTASGELAMSDKDKTEVLNATFQSVFTIDDGYNIKFDCLHTVANMESFEITTHDISAALAKMSCEVSRTPDGIPAYFLMRVAPSIIVVLCYLFNLSLNSSTVSYLISGNKQLLSQFTRKVVEMYLPIIALFL